MGINDIDSENDRRNHLLRISSIGIHRHVFMADGIHRHVIFRMADLIFHTYQVVSRIIETTFFGFVYDCHHLGLHYLADPSSRCG
ncbi:hypothetical protein [Siminovitchia sp. FSL W7-1587]|uniref:hypothetical protein n=1 Tax=Siminovitchia sp. FSL W7-1587 TaxID=2954699 RepID=UPI0030D08B84